jgi:amidase
VNLTTSHDLFLSLVMAAFSVDRSTMSPQFAGALALRSLMSPRGDAAAALRGTIQSHRAWLFRDAARREIAHRWAGFFKEFDVLLLPVTPTAAPGHHNKDHDRFGRTIDVDGVARSYWDQTKWSAVANIAGTPATTMPISTNAAGLPVGIQAMGPAGGDRNTVEFAALLTEVLGGYRVPPRYQTSDLATTRSVTP